MKFINANRKVIIVLLCLLMTITSMVVAICSYSKLSIEKVSTRLDNILDYSTTFEEMSQIGRDFIRGYEDELNIIYTIIFTAGMDKRNVTVEELDYLQLLLPDYTFGFVKNDGTTIFNSKSDEDEDLYEKLVQQPDQEIVQGSYRFYRCKKLDNGWFLMNRLFSEELYHKGLRLSGTSEGVFFWDEEHYSKRTSVNSESYESYSEFCKPPQNRILSFVFTHFFPDVSIGYSDKVHHYLYKERILDDNVVVFAYSELSKTAKEVARNLGVVLAMILLVSLSMCRYAVRICDTDHMASSSSKRFIFGKLTMNLEYFYHLTALLIVCIAIAVIGTTYIQLLTSLSGQNLKAKSTFNCFEESIAENKEAQKKYHDYTQASYSDLTRVLAYELAANPELMDQESLSRICETSFYTEISEISVLNNKGEIVASNMNHVGYSLRSDKDSNEYKVLDILHGKEEKAIIKNSENEYWYLYRRQDEPGIIRVTANPAYAEVTMGYHYPTSPDVVKCDKNDADIMFADEEFPDVLYGEFLYEGTTISRIPNDWPEVVELSDSYTGIRRINGIYYYVNTRWMEGQVIIWALPIRPVIITFFQMILLELVTFFLIYGILILLTACYLDTEVETANRGHIHIQRISEKLMDDSFQKSASMMINISLLLFVVIFVLDSVYSENAMAHYLLSNEWGEGLNLFSFTNILMALLATMVASSLLQKIILLIAKGTSKRGITVGHLVSSMVKFGALVFFIVFSLVQMGLDMRALLAGAGLAGAALAFAGQSVVSDLLSGFFMVFEGKFGVGDWVTVGDFRGQIMEIGVRTTSIAMGGDVKVFHNSDLSGITVWSHGMCGAICLVDIAYREDVERVLNILQQNSDRYLEEIPEMEEPPYIHGVISLGSSGITLRMTSYLGDQMNAGRVQRAMLRVTKRIFEENGISIPFPQVVVHEGEKDIVPVEATIVVPGQAASVPDLTVQADTDETEAVETKTAEAKSDATETVEAKADASESDGSDRSDNVREENQEGE